MTYLPAQVLSLIEDGHAQVTADTDVSQLCRRSGAAYREAGEETSLCPFPQSFSR